MFFIIHSTEHNNITVHKISESILHNNKVQNLKYNCDNIYGEQCHNWGYHISLFYFFIHWIFIFDHYHYQMISQLPRQCWTTSNVHGLITFTPIVIAYKLLTFTTNPREGVENSVQKYMNHNYSYLLGPCPI